MKTNPGTVRGYRNVPSGVRGRAAAEFKRNANRSHRRRVRADLKQDQDWDQWDDAPQRGEISTDWDVW